MSDAELVEKYGGMLLRAEEERDALRARVAELEGVIQTQNGVVVSGTLKLNEARARVAKLEAVLKEMHEHER
jgi:BMFP domain-containing protein YqiC